MTEILMTKTAIRLLPLACVAMLTACATPTLPSSLGHITEKAPPAGAIPDVVQESAPLRPPIAAPKLETYSVTVHNVPVQSLLFALARDAGMNIDIAPGIDGMVTLNAIDQTLPQLLTRIAKQVDMRYDIDGKTLSVTPDLPYWHNYKVDYVNISRNTSSSVNIATQISTTGGNSSTSSTSSTSNLNNLGTTSNTQTNLTGSNNNGNNANGSDNSAANSGNNNSTTSVSNRSDNHFWASLEKNIRDMLRDGAAATNTGAGVAAQPALLPGTVPGQPGASSGPANVNDPGYVRPAPVREASAVIVNAEAGRIAVRATARQQQKVREFMDLVLNSAKRQVLIEATILEVRLSDQYQQGINWSRLGGALTLTQGAVGTAALDSAVTVGSTAGIFTASYNKGNLSSTVQLLESFGKVKVLSSPKISVLNNQTALLKVVDNDVFFTITVSPAVLSSTGTVATPATYESKLQTVPVGFVMSVTPQISDSDEVTLNVRPTITRIVGYVNDPNPALATANVVSKVPVIQAREVESIMKVSNGQIAMMGGLMQDSVDNSKDGVPGLSSLPVIGNLFTYRNEASAKTELVIFLRPVVVKDASMSGDYKQYRYLLPNNDPINAEPYSDRQTAPQLPPPSGGNGS